MRVLRVSHSAVVDEWRGRERALAGLGVDVTLLSARRWHAGARRSPFRRVTASRSRGCARSAPTPHCSSTTRAPSCARCASDGTSSTSTRSRSRSPPPRSCCCVRSVARAARPSCCTPRRTCASATPCRSGGSSDGRSARHPESRRATPTPPASPKTRASPGARASSRWASTSSDSRHRMSRARSRPQRDADARRLAPVEEARQRRIETRQRRSPSASSADSCPRRACSCCSTPSRATRGCGCASPAPARSHASSATSLAPAASATASSSSAPSIPTTSSSSTAPSTCSRCRRCRPRRGPSSSAASPSRRWRAAYRSSRATPARCPTSSAVPASSSPPATPPPSPPRCVDAGGARADELRASGLARAAECTWDAVARDYLDLYRSVMHAASERPAELEVIVVAYGAPAMLRRALEPVAEPAGHRRRQLVAARDRGALRRARRALPRSRAQRRLRGGSQRRTRATACDPAPTCCC